MICVSRELGANIAKCRRRAGVTQQHVADELTRIIGEPVSMHMVSAWERGQRDIPAAIVPSLCQVIHCTSWELYPHSVSLSDKDVLLISTMVALPDDEKDDLIYLLHQWRGNRRALLKLNVIHAVQDDSMRYEADRIIIDNYKAAVRRNDPRLDRRISTDLACVLRAWGSLLDDDDE